MKPSPATDMRGLRTFSLWTVIRTDGFVPQNYADADAMGRGLLYLSIKIWVIQLMFCRNLSDGDYWANVRCNMSVCPSVYPIRLNVYN